MKRSLVMLCLLGMLAGCGISAEPPGPEVPLPEVVAQAPLTPPAQTMVQTPRPVLASTELMLDGGLYWRECTVSGFDWREGEACLGYSLSALQGSGTAGTRTESGDLVLVAHSDTYETRTTGSGLLPRASLYENGRLVRTIYDGTPFHAPNVSLQRIDGKVAWEFYGERVQTIIYDGKDVRSQHGLDAAYRPYELGGKLLFAGKKGNAYFLLYDGGQIGPTFDEITISHCCESSLYAPRFGKDRYVFWGRREGSTYVIEVVSTKP